MKNNGFTLLETIMYCALFSILMSGTIVAVYALMSSSSQTKIDTGTIAEASFINQKLTWLFTSATNVTQISSSSLQVERPDLGADSPVTITVQANNLFITRQSSQPQPLTGLPFNITDTTLEISTSTVSISYSLNGIMFRYQGYIP